MNFEQELKKLQMLSYRNGTEDGLQSAIDAFRHIGRDEVANMLETMCEAMLEVWKVEYDKAMDKPVE